MHCKFLLNISEIYELSFSMLNYIYTYIFMMNIKIKIKIYIFVFRHGGSFRKDNSDFNSNILLTGVI